MPLNNSTFDPRLQNSLFDTAGDYVDWFPGRRCSCTATLDANRGDSNCRVCRGLGYYYVTSSRILGLVTGINSQKQLLESAIALPGDMVFSQRMMDPTPLTDMDMIRLTWDGQPFEGELIVRSDGTTDTLLYPATTLISVAQSDPVSGIVTVYTEGPDFTHATNGTQLVWTNTGLIPAQASTYAVKYLAIFDWVVLTPPNQRYERGTPLGNRVLLRKKHIVLR